MKQACKLAAFKVKMTSLDAALQNELLSFLPDSEKESIASLPAFDPEILQNLPIYAFISRIHSSWLKPLFDALSNQDRDLFLAAFQKRKEELSLAFNVIPKEIKLSSLGKNFVLKEIYDKLLSSPDSLPFPFLSQEPFFSILTLSYEDLHAFLDLLGLYDVALEIPTLVYSHLLKSINEILAGPKAEFLKKIQHDNVRVEFEKIGLSLWDGKQESFKKVLFKRGLHRLSIATSRSSPSFMHHLSLMFSKEEAKNFEMLYKKKRKDTIIDAVKEQALVALTYLNDTMRQ